MRTDRKLSQHSKSFSSPTPTTTTSKSSFEVKEAPKEAPKAQPKAETHSGTVSSNAIGVSYSISGADRIVLPKDKYKGKVVTEKWLIRTNSEPRYIVTVDKSLCELVAGLGFRPVEPIEISLMSGKSERKLLLK